MSLNGSKTFFLLTACFLWMSAFFSVVAAAERIKLRDSGIERAPQLIIDKQTGMVNLDVLFNGTTLLLFGATDAPLTEKDNIVIEVTGPGKSPEIYRNFFIGLLNVNFFYGAPKEVPSLYGLYDARGEINRAEAAERFYKNNENLTDLRTEAREAVLRYLEKHKFFHVGGGGVDVKSRRLFKVELNVPESAPPGEYQIAYYLKRDGLKTLTYRDTFRLEKVGAERIFSDMAQENPFFNASAVMVCAIIYTHLFNFLLKRF